MASFGVIANRLGQAAGGALQGFSNNEEKDRREFLQTLQLAAQLGPNSGIDVSNIPGLISEENELGSDISGISKQFADQYTTRQQLAAEDRAFERLKFDAGQENAAADRALRASIAEMQANTTLQAAGIRASNNSSNNQFTGSEYAHVFGTPGNSDKPGVFRELVLGSPMFSPDLPEGWSIDDLSSDSVDEIVSVAERATKAALGNQAQDIGKIQDFLDGFLTTHGLKVDVQDRFDFGTGARDRANLQFEVSPDPRSMRLRRARGTNPLDLSVLQTWTKHPSFPRIRERFLAAPSGTDKQNIVDQVHRQLVTKDPSITKRQVRQFLDAR